MCFKTVEQLLRFTVNNVSESFVRKNYLTKDCIITVGVPLFIFRNGAEMLDLKLENMFDVNSIMSNMLQ